MSLPSWEELTKDYANRVAELERATTLRVHPDRPNCLIVSEAQMQVLGFLEAFGFEFEIEQSQDEDSPWPPSSPAPGGGGDGLP